MLGRGVSGVWGSCLRPLRPGVLAPDVDSRGLPFTEPLPCKKMEQSKPKSKDRVHRGKPGSAGRWDEQGRPQEGGRAVPEGAGHRARDEESTAQPISGGKERKKALGSRRAKAPPGRMDRPGSQEQDLAWEPGQERTPSRGPREWGAGGSMEGSRGPRTCLGGPGSCPAVGDVGWLLREGLGCGGSRPPKRSQE